MRVLFLIAITTFGITTAQAQTASTAGVGSDPLSVPTQSSPSGFSFSTGFGTSGRGSITATGSAAVGGVSASGGAGTSGISASSSNTQVALQLLGETPNSSTQSAASTAAASSHAASPICPPPVPTSDGGSANLTDMVGGSLNGC
jgi:hypothetical protein